MTLPGGLVAGAFTVPSDDELPGVLAAVAADHPELKLTLPSQPFAGAAILADFRRACEFIVNGYEAPAATQQSAVAWSQAANAWSYNTGRGGATIGADLFTAAAIALGVTIETDTSGTFFNWTDGDTLRPGGRVQLR